MNKYLEQNDHPVISLDMIILNEQDEILLIKRDEEPQKNFWSIVAERIKVDDDSIESAIQRIVREECGLKVKIEYLVDTLANPKFDPPADPRFFVVQILYVVRALTNISEEQEKNDQMKWVDLEEALKIDLAFNHKQLLNIYKENKNKGKLISAERTKFSDYYGKPFNYVNEAFPRMAADSIILNEKNEVLLARRARWPYVGYWDFPGGYIKVNETIKDCAKRQAFEELGVEVEVGELFQVYGDKGQSPKFMTVAAFFFSKIKDNNYNFKKNLEMDDFQFFSLDNLPDKIAHKYFRVLTDLKKFINNK